MVLHKRLCQTGIKVVVDLNRVHIYLYKKNPVPHTACHAAGQGNPRTEARKYQTEEQGQA